jgi:hypothetical protein
MFYCVFLPPTYCSLNFLFSLCLSHTLYFDISIGVPPPRVTWFKEHALIDDSFQELQNGSVRNVLHLTRITRSDLETVIEIVTFLIKF